jgi:hypothetical protein
MNRAILFPVAFFFSCLIFMQFTFSQEDNIKIMIRHFAPSLNIQVLQGSWNRLDFLIENTYNETLTIFYRFEKTSGVEIKSYPSNYYNLDPNTEIAGNLNISVDPYLDNRSYTIRFWIDSFTDFANKTIQSNKFSINLIVLNNPSTSNVTTTTTTTVSTKKTAGEVPIEKITTTVNTEPPTFVPKIPTTTPFYWGSYKKTSFIEYFIIFVIIIFLIIVPVLMLRGVSTKRKTSVSSEEEVKAQQ